MNTEKGYSLNSCIFHNDVGTIWEKGNEEWKVTVDVFGKPVRGYILDDGITFDIRPSSSWLHTTTDYDEFHSQVEKLFDAYERSEHEGN